MQEGYPKLYFDSFMMAMLGWFLVIKTQNLNLSLWEKLYSVDPTDWRSEHSAVVQVGLGSADDQEAAQNEAALLQMKLQLKDSQSPLVDDQKIYSSLARLTRKIGISDVSAEFNNPDAPEELVRAENEILRQNNEQLMSVVQQMQNPLQQAEETKAQASLVKAQGDNEVKLIEASAKAQVEAEKLRQDQNQFMLDLAAKNEQFTEKLLAEIRKHDDNVALDLTKLEMESGQDSKEVFEENK